MATTQLKRAVLGRSGLEITRVGHSEQVGGIVVAANLELSDEDLATIEGAASSRALKAR
jgi:hypothetical protein